MSDKTPARHMDNLPEARKKYWTGDAPTVCDLDNKHIIDKVFIDGKTRMGPWANMCPECFKRYSAGGPSSFGLGRAQKYEKQEDGKWLKTAG